MEALEGSEMLLTSDELEHAVHLELAREEVNVVLDFSDDLLELVKQDGDQPEPVSLPGDLVNLFRVHRSLEVVKVLLRDLLKIRQILRFQRHEQVHQHNNICVVPPLIRIGFRTRDRVVGSLQLLIGQHQFLHTFLVVILLNQRVDRLFHVQPHILVLTLDQLLLLPLDVVLLLPVVGDHQLVELFDELFA